MQLLVFYLSLLTIDSLWTYKNGSNLWEVAVSGDLQLILLCLLASIGEYEDVKGDFYLGYSYRVV